jgi:hypothetical protein
MTTTTASPLPDLCVQEGIDCLSCTASTAKELALACPGLPGKLVAQLFVQIHTYSACARMHRNFAQAYAEALTPAMPQAIIQTRAAAAIAA